MDLKEESILGGHVADHWYYVSKGRALRALLAGVTVRDLLDVGAGSGVFSRQLVEAGVAGEAWCLDPGYAEEHIESRNGHEIRFVRRVPGGGHQLVLLMDVLEHVPDDVALLRQHTRDLPPDGLVIISVPAFQALWSSHDVFLGHQRRYTRVGLEAVVRAAGLRVRRSRYFFGLLLPVVAILRWLERWRPGAGQPASALRRYPRPVNAVLTLIHDLERKALFPVNRLGGLTVFCVASRP